MPDLYNSMLEAYLPEAFIKDRFIVEESQPMDYSYEDYLIEILNKSSWFMEKTKGAKFIKPNSEALGENDAITKGYEIDFKCILSNSIQRARNKTSPQIRVNKEKTATYFMHSKDIGEYKSYKLQGILRNLSSQDFEKLSKDITINKDMPDKHKDLMYFVKTINKKKNLLLYYPALLFFKNDEGTVLDAADNICSSYEIALKHRREQLSQFETYIAFYYEGDLCILSCEDEEPELVDRLNPMQCSPTFLELYRIHDPFIMHPVLSAFG